MLCICVTLDRTSSAEENDTKIIKFGWLDYIPISLNTVIFEFCSTFATNEHIIMSGMAFHYCVNGKPIDPCQQKKHGSNDNEGHS